MSSLNVAHTVSQNVKLKSLQFAYGTHINQIPQCPPSSAKECNKSGWRFTLNPHTPNCFWPPARRSPQRVAQNNYQACSLWALSMYETDVQATLAYAQLKKMIKNIKKAVGDHLSQGSITVDDGKCTPPDHRGHYDFHPYINSNFTSNFNVIRQLP